MVPKQSHKPYAAVGAGQLVSAVWKRGDERVGWHYRFNIFRMSRLNGRVSRLLRPGDVIDLAKLCQVLAATFVDDGCITVEERTLL
jgi:hypothetical protein